MGIRTTMRTSTAARETSAGAASADAPGRTRTTAHAAPASELSSRELASALRVPHPTVLRWLRAWCALGVEGVRRVPAAGRHGVRYVASAELPARWKRGALPAPRLPRAPAAPLPRAA